MEDKIISKIKGRIIYYLSKRDYSKKEIRDKIISRIENSENYIDKIIQDFEEKNYLSDKRFTESFIRFKRSQNNGSIKISQELKLKGVDSNIIKNEIEKYDDWYDLALLLKEKKYGEEYESDFKIRNKQLRYLVGRGFSFEESKYAIENNKC